mmetsp:Transcript_91899/g.176946  ORF Transcript_91899/g.176946 Transcript_91899/m.176946 type:complete len:465 (-) Transcript_91899:51-1445(-)
MELTLLAGHALPKDSILSIRAGGVRRQAVVANGGTIAFPQGLMGDGTLQIDVLRPVGATYMVMKPGESQYKVIFPCGEIEVECAGNCAASSCVEPEQLPPSSVGLLGVEEYLEKYELLQFVQALLHAVIKERPTQVFQYMARHVGSGYSDGEKRAPRRAKVIGSRPLPESTIELSLLAQRGLAQDSIISVRAGAVRRQAAAGNGYSIRFPKISPDENPIKFDWLKLECSSNLILESSSGRYKLQFCGKEAKANVNMSCELEIKAKQFSAEPVRTYEDLPLQQLELLEKEAKEYLQENSIVQFLESLLRAVVRDQPQRPYEYMLRHFACGFAGIDRLGNAGRMRSKRVMSSRASALMSSRASGLSSQPAEKNVKPVSIESIKAKALSILERQQPSKRTERNEQCAASTPDQVEALRRRVQERFLRGIMDGSLRTSMAAAKKRKGPVLASLILERSRRLSTGSTQR